MNILLSSAFFGPVQWYQQLARAGHALIEHCDSYQKQSYRNRCIIATTNGVQALTVPTVHGEEHTTAVPTYSAGQLSEHHEQVRISDHGNWRRQHWQALTSAYGDSPFFQYYEDDLKPFFTERWETLYDYNEAIRQKMCELLDLRPQVGTTTRYLTPDEARRQGYTDLRDDIHPKYPSRQVTFEPRPYYQVYQRKYGFLPNLSILDLLCNMGPESIFWL